MKSTLFALACILLLPPILAANTTSQNDKKIETLYSHLVKSSYLELGQPLVLVTYSANECKSCNYGLSGIGLQSIARLSTNADFVVITNDSISREVMSFDHDVRVKIIDRKIMNIAKTGDVYLFNSVGQLKYHGNLIHELKTFPTLANHLQTMSGKYIRKDKGQIIHGSPDLSQGRVAFDKLKNATYFIDAAQTKIVISSGDTIREMMIDDSIRYAKELITNENYEFYTKQMGFKPFRILSLAMKDDTLLAFVYRAVKFDSSFDHNTQIYRTVPVIDSRVYSYLDGRCLSSIHMEPSKHDAFDIQQENGCLISTLFPLTRELSRRNYSLIGTTRSFIRSMSAAVPIRSIDKFLNVKNFDPFQINFAAVDREGCYYLFVTSEPALMFVGKEGRSLLIDNDRTFVSNSIRQRKMDREGLLQQYVVAVTSYDQLAAIISFGTPSAHAYRIKNGIYVDLFKNGQHVKSIPFLFDQQVAERVQCRLLSEKVMELYVKWIDGDVTRHEVPIAE